MGSLMKGSNYSNSTLSNVVEPYSQLIKAGYCVALIDSLIRFIPHELMISLFAVKAQTVLGKFYKFVFIDVHIYIIASYNTII